MRISFIFLKRGRTDRISACVNVLKESSSYESKQVRLSTALRRSPLESHGATSIKIIFWNLSEKKLQERIKKQKNQGFFLNLQKVWNINLSRDGWNFFKAARLHAGHF